MPNLAKYSKSLAALGALVATVAEALADGSISGTEYGVIATSVAALVAVFQLRNKTS